MSKTIPEVKITLNTLYGMLKGLASQKNVDTEIKKMIIKMIKEMIKAFKSSGVLEMSLPDFNSLMKKKGIGFEWQAKK